MADKPVKFNDDGSAADPGARRAFAQARQDIGAEGKTDKEVSDELVRLAKIGTDRAGRDSNPKLVH